MQWFCQNEANRKTSMIAMRRSPAPRRRPGTLPVPRALGGWSNAMTSVPAPGRAFVLFSAILLAALAATAGAQAPPKDAGTGLAPSDRATTARALELTPAQ